MRKTRRRFLVIDACVVRAAGETEHPVSSSCREFLMAVLRICHRVVMTRDIDREWEEHQSRFTRKWRAAMADHGKPLERIAPVRIQLDPDSSWSENVFNAIEKDRHLLEAAEAADRIIVTLDERLRNALCRTPKGRELFRRFCWINPVTDGAVQLEAGKFETEPCPD